MIYRWIYNICYITYISAIYICYIAWYITSYITLIFIPDLQQPVLPCCCAGAHKNQPHAAPSASSRSLPPDACVPKFAPTTWSQLQPHRPFLAGPSIAPHPRAHLKEPAAIACARTRIGNSPLTTAKAVRKRWVFVASNEAGYQRNTAQHIAHRADV